MTRSEFWVGFIKRAEAYVSAPGAAAGSAERALLWNDHGGVNPRTPEDQQGAMAANLVTLPQDVEGASCHSCAHFRQLDEDLGTGFCTNPQLKQDVTARMVCSLWENPGSHNGAEEQMAAQQQEAPMSESIMQDMAQPDQDPAGALPEQGAPAPGEEAPAPAGEQETSDQAMGNSIPGGAIEGGAPSEGETVAPKKPKGKKGGHTININVGEEKAASAARISQILGRLGRLKKKNYHTTSSSFKTRR